MEKIEVSSNNVSNSNKKMSSNNNLKIALFILISVMLGAGLTYFYSISNPTTVTKNRTISETKVMEESMEDAIRKIYDSVLCIEVLDEGGTIVSTGTGFVYGKDEKYGYILTNAHVVSGGKTIQGKLSNDNVDELTILGTDSYTDLAVLRMDVKAVLQVASIGESKNTKIGNTVFTVGTPMGFSFAGTVTKGILSGKDRLVETSSTGANALANESYIVKVIQTDAAISPGNSGGPLVNLAGDVIGITSLKLVDEQVEGMGFAIPIEDAMNYVDALEKGQVIQRPVMGVQILDLTNKYTLYKNEITIPSNVKQGVVLVKVNDGYPANDSGLKNGDIVTKINGEKITTTAEFRYELYRHPIGDTIEVTYYRDGKENKAKVKLDKAS